jgi:hypothetical protein
MQMVTDQAAGIASSALERFFEQTSRGFDRATDQLGETSHDFRIAGRHVQVRFAGESLANLARPLAHLKCDADSQPAADDGLEILAWQSAEGWSPPRPPWDFGRLAHGGAIAGLDDERVLVNFSGDHDLLCLYHRPTRRALYWLPDSRRLPYWETAAPFRILLHWWSQSFGGHVTHAAAVGRDGEGVLLAGRGGSGKSTTAICCVDAGMEYVGDDYVLLTNAPTPTAHSLYNSAKIHTAFLHRSMPQWRSRVAAEIGPERKSLLFLHECLRSQVRDRLTIRGVIQPKVAPLRVARITRQPQSLGVLAIAPSTMYQLPEARQASLSFFADFMRDVPAYRLDLSTDLSSAPRELSAFLAGKESRHAA